MNDLHKSVNMHQNFTEGFGTNFTSPTEKLISEEITSRFQNRTDSKNAEFISSVLVHNNVSVKSHKKIDSIRHLKQSSLKVRYNVSQILNTVEEEELQEKRLTPEDELNEKIISAKKSAVSVQIGNKLFSFSDINQDDKQIDDIESIMKPPTPPRSRRKILQK